VFTLASDSSGIVARVTSGIFAALANTEIELVPEGAALAFVTAIFPNRLSGIDLLTNETLDLTVTVLSTVDPTGEPQTYEFDLVFYVNENEITRRPVTIGIPADDPKDCSNRPPVIRDLQVPPSVATSATAVISVLADEPDGDSIDYRWTATSGTILEPRGRSTVYQAPGAPALVELAVRASDFEDRADEASALIHVRGGACIEEAQILEVGLTEGRMVAEGSRSSTVAEGSCGASTGAEGLIILRVRQSGRYSFDAGPGETMIVHIKSADCATEVACGTGSALTADLDAGDYFLFVDTPPGTGSGIFNLFVERVD